LVIDCCDFITTHGGKMPFWIACLIVAKTTLCIQFAIPYPLESLQCILDNFPMFKNAKNLSMHS